MTNQRDLNSSLVDERLQAVLALLQKPRNIAVPILERMINDPNPWVRYQARRGQSLMQSQNKNSYFKSGQQVQQESDCMVKETQSRLYKRTVDIKAKDLPVKKRVPSGRGLTWHSPSINGKLYRFSPVSAGNIYNSNDVLSQQHELPVLVIHTGKRTVHFKDNPVRFTAAEFRILLLLAQNHGNYVTKADLYGAGADDYVEIANDTALKTRIKKIRHKLGDSGRNPRYIKCFTGHGYCLDNTVKLEIL